MRLARNYEQDLKDFGKVGFEIRASSSGQHEKNYRLNEAQASFLITLLKNTRPVVIFKKELVRQFFTMRQELQKRQLLRMELKPIRREMTDVIKEVDESKWAYKKYTDLAYKMALGRNAAQIRKERNAPPKAIAVDFLNAEEIAAVSKLESQIAVLLELGMSYEQVKAIVASRRGLEQKAS